MNIYDLICVGVFVLCVAIGWFKGLLRSICGLAFTIASFAITYYLYPYITRFFRIMGLYGYLQQNIAGILNLQGVADAKVADMQAEFINQMPQSNFIIQHLQAGNNPESYHALDVSGYSEYISGFFANMALNLISIILLFIVVRICLIMLLNIMDFVASLPVIHMLNAIGGGIFGMIQGVIVIWIILGVITFFMLDNAEIFDQIESGAIVGYFYENNPIMRWLVKITP